MQAHTRSYSHIQSCAAEVDIATALKGTSITQLIQSVTYILAEDVKKDGYQSTAAMYTLYSSMSYSLHN